MDEKQFETLMNAIAKQTCVQFAGFKVCAELLGAIQANLEYKVPCGDIVEMGKTAAISSYLQTIERELAALSPPSAGVKE